MPMWLNDISTALSAVMIAGLGCVATVAAAYLNLKAKGIEPKEAVKAVTTDRIAYRKETDEAIALAVSIAHSAQQDAAEAKKDIEEAMAVNKTLIDQLEAMRKEVEIYRAQAARVPLLEVQITKLTASLRKYKNRCAKLKAKLAK